MSDDLIRRSDAIKALDNAWINGTSLLDANEAVKQLNDLPPADRPQGEWLDYEIPLEDGGAMPIQVCSLCKTFYPLAYTGGGHRFCPNCGARMKGVSDGR